MIQKLLHISFVVLLLVLSACEKREINDVVIEKEPQLYADGYIDNAPFEFIAGKNACVGETYIIEDEHLGVRFWVFEFSLPTVYTVQRLKFSLIEEIPISEPNGPSPDSILFNEDDLNFSDNDSLFAVPSVLIEYAQNENSVFHSNISIQSESSYFEIGEPSEVTVNGEQFLMVDIQFACELVNGQTSEIRELSSGTGNIAFRIRN